MIVLVITLRHDYWSRLAAAFAGSSLSLRSVSTMDEALETIKNAPPVLAILDVRPESGAGTQAEDLSEVKANLTAILAVNAMVHTAVVSALSEESVHDALEGYGVLLHIPPNPDEQIVNRLSGALHSVGAK